MSGFLGTSMFHVLPSIICVLALIFLLFRYISTRDAEWIYFLMAGFSYFLGELCTNYIDGIINFPLEFLFYFLFYISIFLFLRKKNRMLAKNPLNVRTVGKKQYLIYIIDFIIISITACIIFYCFDLRIPIEQASVNLNLSSSLQFVYPVLDFLLLGYYVYLSRINIMYTKKVFISLTVGFLIWTMGDFIYALEVFFYTDTKLGGTFLTIGLVFFMIVAYIVKISEDKRNYTTLDIMHDNLVYSNYAVAMTVVVYIFVGLYIYSAIYLRADDAFKIMGGCAIVMLFLMSLRHCITQHETKLKMDEMRESANVDPLTGLYNRRFAFKLINNAFKSSRFLNIKISALMMDIDHFKKYNDTWGHACGDQILRDITQLINHSIGMANIICRYGGEEILVVLPGADEQKGMEVAENIRENIEKYIFYYENIQPVGKVTISIGGATADDDTEDEFQLIKKADYALYESKKTRNRCSWINMDYLNKEDAMKS